MWNRTGKFILFLQSKLTQDAINTWLFVAEIRPNPVAYLAKSRSHGTKLTRQTLTNDSYILDIRGIALALPRECHVSQGSRNGKADVSEL